MAETPTSTDDKPATGENTSGKAATKSYVLAADGMRMKGHRYRRGDVVTLPAEDGDRLVKSGSLTEKAVDLPPALTPAQIEQAGARVAFAPVAAEPSTIDAAQSVDENGEIKPSSFGHPDRVAAAEEATTEQVDRADATKPPAARRRTKGSTAEAGGAADTGEKK